MIHASFLYSDGLYTGFTVKGHAGAAEYGRDIVCSAVSSAVYLTVNTMTEIIKVPVDVTEKDGFMRVSLNGDYERCQDILSGLYLHLKELAKTYKDYISISIKSGNSR